MYASIDFQSKTELRSAVAAGQDFALYSPLQSITAVTGVHRVEGPWSLRNTWHAYVRVQDGRVVEVLR